MIQISLRPKKKPKIPITQVTIKEIPLDKPSKPSIKLIALVTPTIHINETKKLKNKLDISIPKGKYIV